jgi:uncharacterized membrane protein YedE/YeeE
MEKTQIERDYDQILEGTSCLEKRLILLLTGLLYIGHTRIFGFVFMGVCTYPTAWLYYLHGASEAVFAGAAAIHLLVFEITYWFWNKRKQELKNLKLALTEIIHHIKQQK